MCVANVQHKVGAGGGKKLLEEGVDGEGEITTRFINKTKKNKAKAYHL